MQPVEPTIPAPGLARNWQRVVYAEKQPEYIPLPTLQERQLQPSQRVPGAMEIQAARVISYWEPTDVELLELQKGMLAWARGGPKPRIGLMLHTFGSPLQPIRMIVGEFIEPFETPADTKDAPPLDSRALGDEALKRG